MFEIIHDMRRSFFFLAGAAAEASLLGGYGGNVQLTVKLSDSLTALTINLGSGLMGLTINLA